MNNPETAGASAGKAVFHRGERAVQQRAGVLEKMAARSQVIRAAMPDQHREFFNQLPFMIVGSVDRQQQPWASIVIGAPGFVSSPDAEHLRIHAHALAADPLQQTLAANAAIGLLGIEPHTRRRNRMNGRVEQLDAEGWTLKVEQSFGNCPKYIQARRPSAVDNASAAAPRVHRASELDGAMQQLIGSADTFFIATAFLQDPSANGPAPRRRRRRSSCLRPEVRPSGARFSHPCLGRRPGNKALGPARPEPRSGQTGHWSWDRAREGPSN